MHDNSRLSITDIQPTYDLPLSALNEIMDKLDDKNMVLYMENYNDSNKDVTAKKKQ